MFESGCFPRESGRFFYVVYEHEKSKYSANYRY